MKFSLSVTLLALLSNGISVHATTDLGAGFITATSDVTEQANIALDIKDMRDKLRRRDFGGARTVYENGANSQGTTVKRSLQKFSTAAGAQDNKFADVPAFWFHVWGITSGNYRTLNDFLTYGDDYVTNALEDRNSGTIAAEAALVLNTWMYIAHNIYDALGACRAGDSTSAFEAIDEAAAFWVGADQSLALGSGHGMFELTQQVDSEFDMLQSVAVANEKFKDIHEKMTFVISRGGCRTNSAETGAVKLYHLGNEMISVMMIPLMKKLIQAIVDDDVQMIKLYTLSIVPQIFAVHTSVGRLLMDRLYYFDYDSNDEDEVIRKLQSTYSGLGFTCEDIGRYRSEVRCEEPGNELVGYEPSTDVREEAQIDLDILHIKILCRASAFNPALDIYVYGKHSNIGSEYEYLTLQELATGENRKAAEPWFGYFEDYYNGDENYADTFILQSLAGSGRFTELSDLQRGEFIFKGLQYQVTYMAALGEFYTSFEMCKNRDSDSASAWDKGVAYAVGSIEGTQEGGEPTSDGMMLYNLANKRCSEWNTCQTEDSNDKRAAKARLIVDFEQAFEEGGNPSRCDDIKEAADKLALDLLIPVMQGSMRYAIKNANLNPGTTSKDLAEGEIFSTGYLPLVAQFDSRAQATIERNMLINIGQQPVPDGPQAVADAINSVITDFGATCSDVGYHDDVNVNVCGITESSDSGDEPWWCFLRPQDC